MGIIRPYSNQFPVESKESVPINTRANLFWAGLKDNLPNLYDYIMNQTEKTNEKKIRS